MADHDIGSGGGGTLLNPADVRCRFGGLQQCLIRIPWASRITPSCSGHHDAVHAAPLGGAANDRPRQLSQGSPQKHTYLTGAGLKKRIDRSH